VKQNESGVRVMVRTDVPKDEIRRLARVIRAGI
jgi:hypothetical protein